MNKITGESNYEFEERKKMYQKMKEKCKEEEAVRYSLIWANIKFRRCKYDASIYYNIKKFDNEI